MTILYTRRTTLDPFTVKPRNSFTLRIMLHRGGHSQPLHTKHHAVPGAPTTSPPTSAATHFARALAEGVADS